MSELTQEQIAQVARIVTGLDYRLIDKLIAVKTEENRLDYVWMPAFHDIPLQRSQALAILEWIYAALWADYTNGEFSHNIDYNRRLYHAATARVAEHVYHKDTTALMAMVLELSEKS